MSPPTNKRQSQGSETGKVRAQRQVSAPTAFLLKTLIAIGILLLLVCAYGVFTSMKLEDTSKLRWVEGASTMLAHDFEKRVASIRQQLQQWAADPQVGNALRAQEPDLRLTEDALARTMPDALRVRLLRPEICEGKSSQTASLSYAGLDLVCQAARQRRVTQLEMHRLGSPEEHLAIAAPVLGAHGKELRGLLHLSLSASLLPSASGVVEPWGRLLLQQSVAGEVVTLGLKPGSTIPSGPPDQVTPIKGTRLQIAAWANWGEGPDSRLLQVIAAAYLVLMVLVALAIWLPLRGLGRALASDYEALLTLVEDVVRKKPLRSPQYQLAQTQPFATRLMDLLRGKRSYQVEAETQVPETGPQVAEHQLDDAGRPIATKPTEQAREAVQETGTRSGLEPESVPASIFRAYDIRGVVDRDLSADLMHALGRAIGTEASEAGNQTVILGRDTRPSSKGLSKSLSKGLQQSGCDVLDLGVVPTPVVYFATRFQGEVSGVMVTASHNPEKYNGLKVVVGGATLGGERIKALRERILAGRFTSGEGTHQAGDLVPDYIDHVQKDVAIARRLKVAIDCGNAAAAVVAPQLFRELGADLVELDCDTAAGFPGGRVPDPSLPECLESLRQTVISQRADLGLAFDADGDRLGVVDSSGKIIWPDRVLMLLAADVLSRHPGTDVIFDVKSTHFLTSEILRHGGRPVMWKSGHAPLKAKLQETGALLAGERSGHIIFRDRWLGFDDALYAGARLLEVLALDPRSSAEIFAELPEAIGTPELLLPLSEGEAARIMDVVLEQVTELSGFYLNVSDGLRVESEREWGLVRQCNTQPALVFRFEANDEAGLASIQRLFRDIMGRADPNLKLPF